MSKESKIIVESSRWTITLHTFTPTDEFGRPRFSRFLFKLSFEYRQPVVYSCVAASSQLHFKFSTRQRKTK